MATYDRRRIHHNESEDEGEHYRPRVSPGKVSLTSRLPASAVASRDVDPVQRRVILSPNGQLAPSVGQVQQSARLGVSGSGQRMPHYDLIERAFGLHNVSEMEAHVGGPAKAANNQMGASAYAFGNRVAFKEQPDLHTAAHEAAHVVQQRSGRVASGLVGSAGDTHERHADAVADAVVRGDDASALLDRYGSTSGASVEAIQRVDGPLEDRDIEHTFHNTQSLAEFEAEVRSYLAGQVRSRSTNEETGNAIHREVSLFPEGRLSTLYDARDRGNEVVLMFHFHSNGYSYRSVAIARDMEPEPEPEPEQEQEQEQDEQQPSSGAGPQGRPPAGTRADELRDAAARRDIIVSLAQEVATPVVEGIIVGLGSVILSECIAFIGAIQTAIELGSEIYRMIEPAERDTAKGFGAAVMANRIAEYTFTQSDRQVWARAWDAIRRYLHDEHRQNQRTGEFMQTVINESQAQFTEIRQQINQSQGRANDSDQRFEDQGALADYLVAHTPDVVSVSLFMRQWHTSYRSQGVFSVPR